MILDFSVNDPFPKLPIHPEMDKSHSEHATEYLEVSYVRLEPIISGSLHGAPLYKFFAFRWTTLYLFSQIFPKMHISV